MNKTGPVKKHFLECGVNFDNDCVSILASVGKSEKHLMTLEALFIREFRPTLNTKDEYRRRELKIRI